METMRTCRRLGEGDQRSVVAALVAVAAAAVLGACSGGSPMAPSPVIAPDAIGIRAGQAQVFTVQNAVVSGFSLVCECGDWKQVVAIDPEYHVANAVRLIGLKPIGHGHLFLTADLGHGRSPLVAVIDVGQ